MAGVVVVAVIVTGVPAALTATWWVGVLVWRAAVESRRTPVRREPVRLVHADVRVIRGELE